MYNYDDSYSIILPIQKYIKHGSFVCIPHLRKRRRCEIEEDDDPDHSDCDSNFDDDDDDDDDDDEPGFAAFFCFGTVVVRLQHSL